MGRPNERCRDASRVDQRHEVQTESGELVRVRAAGTLHLRSGWHVRVLQFIDGGHDWVQLHDEVVSRVSAGAR